MAVNYTERAWFKNWQGVQERKKERAKAKKKKRKRKRKKKKAEVAEPPKPKKEEYFLTERWEELKKMGFYQKYLHRIEWLKKKEWKKNGTRIRHQYLTRYAVVDCHNGTAIGKRQYFTTYKKAYETVESLFENAEKVIFPVKYKMDAKKQLKRAKNEYLIIRKKGRDTEIDYTELRNDIGKMEKHRAENGKWLILDKFPHDVEETFDVWGYDNRRDRKTFLWIFENIVLSDIETQYDFKKIIVYLDKIVIKNDRQIVSVITCKCKNDAIRFYNLLCEFAKERGINQLLFYGSFNRVSQKRRDLEKELLELTGWSMKRLRSAPKNYKQIR